jgi:hypothetical protein
MIMEDNVIFVFLGVMLCTLIFGAYNGLVVQYPNVLIILLGATIVYLILLEMEFRQLKKIAFKMGDEESILTKSLNDLKAEVEALRREAMPVRPRTSRD